MPSDRESSLQRHRGRRNDFEVVDFGLRQRSVVAEGREWLRRHAVTGSARVRRW